MELLPLAVFGLYGGVLADRFDRRRLIVACEAGLAYPAALFPFVAANLHTPGSAWRPTSGPR